MSGNRVSSHASRVASGCALVVMALGLAVMAGWWLGIDPLKRVLPGLASMKFNTALGFLLAGGALFFRGKTTLRRGLAATVGLLGALTLGEYFSGIDFGIDQIFTHAVEEVGQAAGRMSQATALCSLLGGAALALLGAPRRDGVRWAEVLAIGMGTIGFIAVLGYALNAQDLYRIPGFSSMALHTSAGFIVLAAGILSAVPEGIVGRLLRGTGRPLWLGFGVLTALLIFLGVVSVSQLRSIAAKVDVQAEVARPRAEATLAMEANVVSYGLNVVISLIGDEGARLLAEDDAVDVARALADYERLAETLQQQDLAARFRAQWLELHAHGEALMAAGVHDREGLVRLATLRRALEAFLKNEIQPEAVAAFESRRAAAQATLRYTEEMMLFLLVCGVVLALMISGAVIRTVLGSEAALRVSEERWRYALEISELGAWELDLANQTAWRSLRHDQIFGYAELLPDWSYDVFLRHVLEEDRAEVDRSFRHAMTEHSPWNFECRIRRVDGAVRWIWAYGKNIGNAERHAGRMFGLVSDITERKRIDSAIRQLNEELELRVRERTADLMATNRELEAFSYSVSHDLRSPLRAVDGFSQMVLAEYAPKLDDEGRRMLGVIRSEAQRMGRLVDDLLAFFRLGRQQIESASVDMHAMAREVFDELAALEPKRQLRLDLQPLPPARGTATMIRQVWVNLIDNAIKFTKDREVAEIEIGMKEGGDGERIYYVRDNGVGFDMQYVDKLFGVFQRLHSQQEFPGTGVGLALVQRIVQRHGGRVWAEGEVNRGATFYFALPNQS